MKRPVKRHEVQQPLDTSYRLIPLTQGQNTIVDAEDFEWLSKTNWVAQWSKFTKSFYARTSTEPHRGMHRLILNCKSKKQIDHWNHNTLDNRKQNLRECTSRQNHYNLGKSRNNNSGYKGVSWDKRRGQWQASIRINGRNTRLGLFYHVEEAAHAYDEASKIYHGEFGFRNFG